MLNPDFQWTSPFWSTPSGAHQAISESLLRSDPWQCSKNHMYLIKFGHMQSRCFTTHCTISLVQEWCLNGLNLIASILVILKSGTGWWSWPFLDLHLNKDALDSQENICSLCYNFKTFNSYPLSILATFFYKELYFNLTHLLHLLYSENKGGRELKKNNFISKF